MNDSSRAEQWFSEIDLHNMTVLYVYGLDEGNIYKAAKGWLRENRHHVLVLIDDDEKAIERHCKEAEEDFQVEACSLSNSKKLYKDVIESLCFRNYKVVSFLGYQTSKRGEFNELKGKIDYFVELYGRGLAEHISYGVHLFGNFYRNLLDLPKAYLANALFGAFRNVPAIICGAGPSLEKNGHFLNDLKNRALIFAGGTAMNALNGMGVIPHFGVGIDPFPYQYTRILANEAYGVPYFYTNRINHSALKVVHGDRLFVAGVGGHVISKYTEERLGIAGAHIETGANVVNFSLSLARCLGCNPIICVGVDLAYTDGASYASSVETHALHTKKQHYYTKTAEEELVLYKGVNGQPVQTLWKWIRESSWFARVAAEHPKLTFINATEGGIGFKGVPNQTLKEVAETYLTKEHDLEARIHAAMMRSQMPQTVDEKKIQELLEKISKSLERCEELSEEIRQGIASEKDSDEIDEVKEVLRKEIADIHILSDFRKAYEIVYQRQLKPDLERAGPELVEELAEDKEKARIAEYDFAAQAAEINRTLLDHALQEEHKANPWGPMEEKGHPLSEIKKTGERCYYYPSGQPFAELSDEKQLYYYPNGQLKTALTFTEGKFDGPVLLYYPDGAKKREVNYKQGKRHGSEWMWSPEGKALVEAEYDEGKPVGVARCWHENGLLAREVTYDAEGNLELVQEWDFEGNLIAEAEETDYYEAVTKQTDLLADSLSEVYKGIEKIAPKEEKGTIQDDLQELKREMEKLHAMKGDMLTEMGDKGPEAIWKSPTAKRSMELHLEEMTKAMEKELTAIQDVLKLTIEKKKAPEDDKK